VSQPFQPVRVAGTIAGTMERLERDDAAGPLDRPIAGLFEVRHRRCSL